MINNTSQTATYLLADENSFYYRFERDLREAKNEVIIESPFITIPKMRTLKPIFESLIKKTLQYLSLQGIQRSTIPSWPSNQR